MKRTLLYSLIIFLLASCQQEDTPVNGIGSLLLTSLTTTPDVTTTITTRAVSPDLSIEILKADDGTTVCKLEAGSPEASGKIELEAGNYLLKAYSTNYATAYENTEKGEPKYYVEQPFSIALGKVNYLSVQVPMINFGIRLVLPENFTNQFNDYTFEVTYGERNLAIQGEETAYFDIHDETILQYTLTATNTDNETQSITNSYSSLSAGNTYEITYTWATRSLSQPQEI